MGFTMWELNRFKDNLAVITENGEKYTYAQLNAFCENLTSNIKERCLVFNLCRNEIGSLVGYVGFLNANIVPLMLKADLDDELLNECLNTYRPDYINVPSEMADRFTKFSKVFDMHAFSQLNVLQRLVYVRPKTEGNKGDKIFCPVNKGSVPGCFSATGLA